MSWPYSHVAEYFAYYKVEGEEREKLEREQRVQADAKARLNNIRGR